MVVCSFVVWIELEGGVVRGTCVSVGPAATLQVTPAASED